MRVALIARPEILKSGLVAETDRHDRCSRVVFPCFSPSAAPDGHLAKNSKLTKLLAGGRNSMVLQHGLYDIQVSRGK